MIKGLLESHAGAGIQQAADCEYCGEPEQHAQSLTFADRH
jgi:hypothetical protein